MTTSTANVAEVLPAAAPLLVRDAHVGGAISEGPAILLLLTGDDGRVAALQWETAEQAEKHLAAALAHVRSWLPLPAVVQLRPATEGGQP